MPVSPGSRVRSTRSSDLTGGCALARAAANCSLPHLMDDTATADADDRAWMESKLYRVIMLGMLLSMSVELATLVWAGRWMQVAVVTALITALSASWFAGDRFPVKVPVAIQFVVVIFIFAAIFLGEVRDFYERIWWWDIALHTSSGVLLGLLGFIVIYVLNENDVVDIHMRPVFQALFAFFFAVALGAIWEIFEFTMDQLFGLNMQKPMLGDPSGLTDTMWDLIVDTLGAAVACIMAWIYMRRARKNGSDYWLARFADKHPDFFGGRTR